MIDNSLINEQYDTFRENIKYYRKKLNLTQEELAEKSDLSISYIKQIESNRNYTNVTLTSLLKISKALNKSLEELFRNNLK